MSAFDVKYPEVQDLQNKFLSYSNNSGEALSNIGAEISSFTGLASFQGEGAESAKAYFSEVYPPLLSGITQLAEQLQSEYADHYYSQLSGGVVQETDPSARWHEDEMAKAIKKLKSLCEGDFEAITSGLRRAMEMVPAGYSFDIPLTTQMVNAGDKAWQSAEKVRQGVEDAEAEATQVFMETGDFEKLATGLAAAISSCADGTYSLVNYEGGSFRTKLGECGVIEAYKRCEAYQVETADTVIDAQKNSINNEKMRVEEARQKAAEEKHRWEIFGTVASVVVLVSSIAATVVTFGSAAPTIGFALSAAYSVVGTASAIGDYAERLDGVMFGDSKRYEPDEEKSAWEEAGDEAVSGGKTMLGAGGKYFKAKQYEQDGMGYKAAQQSEGLKTTGKKFLIDQVLDAGIDHIEDDGMKTGAKVAKTIGMEGYSQYRSYVENLDYMRSDTSIVSNVGATVGMIGKVGTIIADYGSDQANERIGKCDERINELKELNDNVGVSRSESFGYDW